MRYHPVHRLAFVLEPGDATAPTRVTLMQLPNGEPMILEGSSAVIWRLACEGADVLDALSGIVGRPAADIAMDTEAFLADLVARGLLIADASN